MSSSKVLKELNELKEEWKKQYFQFTEGQRVRYTELLNKRREIVSNYYKNGQVSTSSKLTTKPVKEEAK